MEKDEAQIETLSLRPNVVVAIGNRIQMNSFDRWLPEAPRPQGHVPWVHTKFILVDPLSKAPITITGSANWTSASTSDNNENMVIIRGDQRVANIYLGEFMRLHAHYAFRETLAHKGWGEKDWNPNSLISDASWLADHYDQSEERGSKRLYFAGS